MITVYKKFLLQLFKLYSILYGADATLKKKQPTGRISNTVTTQQQEHQIGNGIITIYIK